MADVITNALTELATVIAAVTTDDAGINQAVINPPEGINDPPMVITKVIETDISYSRGYNRTVSTVWCDLLLARSTLPEAEKLARPFIMAVIEAVAGELSLTSTATHCILTSALGPRRLDYQGEVYYGIRFIGEIKINHTFTVAA